MFTFKFLDIQVALWYPNAQDEIWVQRKCSHNFVIIKACMLGNQSDVFNLNKKRAKRNLKKQLLYNQRHAN